MHQIDIAFEGICSLRDIEMVVKPLNIDKEIKDNLGDLKKFVVNFNPISYTTVQNLHIRILLIYREVKLLILKNYIKS